MSKIKSLDELRKFQAKIKKVSRTVDEFNETGNLIYVKVAMATCGLAAGAREIKDFFTEALDKRGIDAIVTPTGCMGYCYAEPTIEITLPGNEPVVFGDVDIERADKIIEKYIKNNEIVEGVIPVNYRTIDT